MRMVRRVKNTAYGRTDSATPDALSTGGTPAGCFLEILRLAFGIFMISAGSGPPAGTRALYLDHDAVARGSMKTSGSSNSTFSICPA